MDAFLRTRSARRKARRRAPVRIRIGKRCLERVVPHLHHEHVTPLCRVACFCGSIRCALVLASNGAAQNGDVLQRSDPA